MARLYSTFSVPETQPPLQIIPYEGPPKPKQTPRRNPSKVPSSGDRPGSNTERGNKEDPSLTSDGLEVIDLTCLAENEGNCETSGRGGGESGDAGSDDGFYLLEATTHQPQHPMEKKVESEGKLPMIEDTSSSGGSSSSSSSGSDTDDDYNDRSANHTTPLTRKRKRSSPTKGRIHASKQRPKHNAHSMRRRKSSPIRGKPNRPSALEPLSAARYSSHDATTRHSDDSSGASSEDNTDDGADNSTDDSTDSACHLASNKRPTLTARPVRPNRHKRKRNRGSADEEDEYEVEMILDAHVHHGKLQYRVKWLGYEDDPMWYDAGNFKNSPHKLRSFHTANPLQPGPSKRLGIWAQCWEEDRDAADHPDDNKPERAYTRCGAP